MSPRFPPKYSPIKLYRHVKSGHCHRAELMLALLDLPYESIDVDLAGGAHKLPDSLQLNPFAKVPVIDDNGVVLSDSNAILVYLAHRYSTDHTCGSARAEALGQTVRSLRDRRGWKQR